MRDVVDVASELKLLQFGCGSLYIGRSPTPQRPTMRTLAARPPGGRVFLCRRLNLSITPRYGRSGRDVSVSLELLQDQQLKESAASSIKRLPAVRNMAVGGRIFS